jgi:hypothetical protein
VTGQEEGQALRKGPDPESVDLTADDGIIPDVFAILRRFRLAARGIARDEALGPRRYPALTALVEQARKDFRGDPWLSATVQRVIYAECVDLLQTGRTPTAPEPSWHADPVTRTLQAMHCEGYASCPTCRRPLPSLDVLAKWEDRDRAAWRSRVDREEAPEREAAAGHEGGRGRLSTPAELQGRAS